MTTPLMNYLLAATHQGFFYPEQASTIAKDLDPLAWFIHGITIFFTVGIIGATVYFCWKYRASVHPVPQPPGHNNILEVTWTAIPAIIVFICFFWGFRVYMKMVAPRPGAETIQAVGQTWFWQFKYRNPANGNEMTVPDMYMPLNEPVRIQLESIDVIHSLFMPAMRMKRDVVPGRYNEMYIEANKVGDYDIYCAEYCGDGHSQMASKVHVLPHDEYIATLAKLGDPLADKGKVPDSEIGLKIVTSNGCFSCHSVDGKAGTGPTWKDMFGAQVELADGSSVKADEAYVHESIRNPNAKVVKGFGPPSAMNPFTETQIPETYMPYIFAYMRSISANAPHDANTTNPAMKSQAEEHGRNAVPDKTAPNP